MTVYLSMDDLVAIGTAAVAPTEFVIRDPGLLASALARPESSAFGEDAYPTLHVKAAALLESLARNHALLDGNKRLAWVATVTFLALNDVNLEAPTPQKGDEFVRSVAQGVFELSAITEILIAWQ